MIPNILFALKYKTGFENNWKNKYIEVFEQIGRYGCFFTMIFNSGYEKFVSENPMFAIYARIPTRIFLHEVIFIFLFGVFSSVAATWLASRNILRMTVTEVLRDE